MNAEKTVNNQNDSYIKRLWRNVSDELNNVSDKVNKYKTMLRQRIKEDVETFKENEKNYKNYKKERKEIKENIFKEIEKFESLMDSRDFDGAKITLYNLRNNSGSILEDKLIDIYANENFENRYVHHICRKIMEGIETGQIPEHYDELDGLRIAKTFNFDNIEIQDIAIKTYLFELNNAMYRTANYIKSQYKLDDEEIINKVLETYKNSIIVIRQ